MLNSAVMDDDAIHHSDCMKKEMRSLRCWSENDKNAFLGGNVLQTSLQMYRLFGLIAIYVIRVNMKKGNFCTL